MNDYNEENRMLRNHIHVLEQKLQRAQTSTVMYALMLPLSVFVIAVVFLIFWW